MREKGLKTFVDSIDNGVCRLLIGAKPTPVEMPLHLLPMGTEEGSTLLIKFLKLKDTNNANKNKIDELLRSFHDECLTKNSEHNAED